MYGDNPPVTFGDSPLYTRGPLVDALPYTPSHGRTHVLPLFFLRQANLYTAGLLHSSVPSFCKTSSYPPPGRLK